MTCVRSQDDRPVFIAAGMHEYAWVRSYDFVRIMQDKTYWTIRDVPRAADGQQVRITVGFSGNEGTYKDPTEHLDEHTAYSLGFYAQVSNPDIVATVLSYGGESGCWPDPREQVYVWDAARFNAVLDNPPEDLGLEGVPYGPGLHFIVTSGYHVGLLPGDPHPVPDCGTSQSSVNAFVVEIAYVYEEESPGTYLPTWTEDLCPTAVFGRTPELDPSGQTTGRWLFVTTHPIRANGAEHVGFNIDPCRHHLARRVVGDNGQSWLEYCSTPHPDEDQFKRAHRAYRCVGPIEGANIEAGYAAWAGTYHAPMWTEVFISSQPQVCDLEV